MSSTQMKPSNSPPTNPLVLALDLGNHLGFALGRNGERPVVGTQVLQKDTQRRFESSGMKWIRLREFLDGLYSVRAVERVALEEVRRHLGVDAAHAYGGALAVVTAWCEEKSVPCQAVPVATIKKFATGKGNANKEMMVAAAQQIGFNVDDDNQADALHLWRLVTGADNA